MRQHRITFKPNGNFYGTIQEIAIKLTTAGASDCKAKTEVLLNDTWKTVGTEWNEISGWPGWNFIKMEDRVFRNINSSDDWLSQGFRITIKIGGYSTSFDSACYDGKYLGQNISNFQLLLWGLL